MFCITIFINKARMYLLDFLWFEINHYEVTPDLLDHNCSTVWYFNKRTNHKFIDWGHFLMECFIWIFCQHLLKLSTFSLSFSFSLMFLYKNNEWFLHTKIRFFYKNSLPKSTEDNDNISIDTLPLMLLLPSWNKVIIKIKLGKRKK